MSFFTNDEPRNLLRPELAELVSDHVLTGSYARLAGKAAAADPITRILHLNARTYLLDDLTVKVDRVSMALGLETRSPFLDTALTEFVATLPGRLKVNGASIKWILRRSMRDLLPDEVVNRKKMGFRVPLGAWFRCELQRAVEERFRDAPSPLASILTPGALRRFGAWHASGQRNLGGQLWALWQLDVWMRGVRAP